MIDAMTEAVTAVIASRATRAGARRGVTLVELMVTLALIGLLAGVVGLTLHTAPRAPSIDAPTARLVAARDSALRLGVPVTIALTVDGHSHVATALPDGRVIADSAFAIDAMSGTVRHDSP
jgi:prepilin-type N-terminal cleavage/methylation domain-containing protein